MNYKTISLKIANKICILKLNRADKLNILGKVFFKDFNHAINYVKNNLNIHVLVITGDNNFFSAGGDLKEIVKADTPKTQIMCKKVQESFESLLNLEIPVIAALSGIVYGGGLELALHCDIRFCSKNTSFKLPESNLGIIPGAGGISIFSKIFGNADAAYYLMSGNEIPIELALHKGMIQKVFENDELINKTIEFANELSIKSKSSLSAIKKVLVSNYFNTTEECKKLELNEFVSTLNIEGKDKINAFLKSKLNKS